MRAWSRYPALGRCLLLLVTAVAILGPVEAVTAADRQKQVLVLYSTRRDAEIAVVGDREMPRILEQGLEHGVDYYAEYIDLARFSHSEYRGAFSDFLRLKYQGQQFDLIIAMQSVAVEFIGETRDTLFPDTPLVFFSDSPVPPRVVNSTGVTAEVRFGSTVALAATLHPDLRHVFVVAGADNPDKNYERQARAQLQSFEPRLTVSYLSGLPTKELEARLATLPDHSMVYFLLVSQDGAGENYHPLEYLDRVTAVANAPTYCWVDSAMNHGIVGGGLKSQEAEVRAVATLALRVLRGEPADSIPLSSSDLTVPQVDWRQLRRWGISEALVPAGTLIRFREPSAWDRYRGYIAGASGLILAQAVLIAGLLVQRVKRRQAEAKLQASQAELHSSYARLVAAQENEGSRIARELHDDIGQRMAALTMELDSLGGSLPPSPPDARIEIGALSNRARDLAVDIQTISHSMHSSKLDHMSLARASADVCRELSEQQNIDVRFSSRDMPDDVPTDVALCVFRVLQEAVNNAVKHSRARRVTVTLWGLGNEIRLEVADDGIGLDPDRATKGPGLGLISMKERLSLVKGEIVIESATGAGATIRARVPLGGPGAQSAAAVG